MSLPDLEGPLALLEQKDFDTAVEVLEHKVTAMPAHLGAHVLLAYAYEAQQRWSGALESWANAQFLMPNSPLATAGKRRVLRRMDGIEDGESSTPLAEGPPLKASPTDQSASATNAPSTKSGAADKAPEEAGTEDSGLAQLRRQAEQEARRGGARPDLSDTPPSPEPPSPSEESSTPEEQVERLEETDDDDDLDRLIDELQSARIEPEPDAATDVPSPSEKPNPPDEDDTEEIVSETLARIHAGQDDYQTAARIYTQLAEQEPARADEFRKKAAEMREKADGPDDTA